jgi:hypothetical protein
MSKIIFFNLMTVDGFFEGPHKEIDWHNVDSEFNDFTVEQLNNATDTIDAFKDYLRLTLIALHG